MRAAPPIATAFRVRGGMVDPPWNPSVAHLIRIADCPALPLYFKGSNGLGFQLIGALHPRLRTADLPRQTLNKHGQIIDVRIGRPVAAKSLRSFADEREAIEYLRFRTFLLASRDNPSPDGGLVRFPVGFPKKRLMPLAPETPRQLTTAETGHLTPVCENQEFAVYLAQATAIPHTLREIGRLRGAGEGTGDALDLDRFDPHYLHLFLWTAREVAGAYRLGSTAELLPRFGVPGCTPAPCSTSTRNCSRASDRRWKWAALSYGRSIRSSMRRYMLKSLRAATILVGRASTPAAGLQTRSVDFQPAFRLRLAALRRCCCCGRASRAMSRRTRNAPFCLEPQASATITIRFRAVYWQVTWKPKKRRISRASSSPGIPIARASAPSLARHGAPKPRAASRGTWRNSPRPSPTWSATAKAYRS